MARKIKDLAVKIGEYKDRDGNTKRRYQNVGALMKSDDGNTFIMLSKWFNPAGIQSDRDTILISCFDLRDNNDSGGGRSSGGGGSSGGGSAAALDDEIPF